MISEEKDDVETTSASEAPKAAEPADEPIAAPQSDAPSLASDAESPDFEEILKNDMLELSGEFSTTGKMSISDLKNPIRYGALRDLGLTPREAYLASGGRKEAYDNRAHLSSSVPRKMSSQFCEIPRAELDAARELFGDMSDGEIRNLYRKVTQ